MRQAIVAVGIVGLLPLLLGGCGWEPLAPMGPEGELSPADLAVEIVYECPLCLRPEGGDAPLSYTFQAEVTLPNPETERVLVYNWDFGDGTKDEGARVTHTFAEPGNYRVRLRVITSQGHEATDELKLRVQPPPELAPEVQADRVEGEFCRFERLLPLEIRVGEPFTVEVVLTAKREVWVAQWEDYTWPQEFILLTDPSWSNALDLADIPMDAGERVVVRYDVRLWQTPTGPGDPWMSGTLKCTPSVQSVSETLTLRSELAILAD